MTPGVWIPTQRYGEACLNGDQTLTFNVDELAGKIYKPVFFHGVHMGPVESVAGQGDVKQTVAVGARQSLPEGLPQCKHLSATLSFRPHTRTGLSQRYSSAHMHANTHWVPLNN